MALTDKLTAIANAIRAKSYKIRPLTLEQMVEEINNEWLQPGEQRIKHYVKDFYLKGSFDKISSDFTPIYSYTPDGKIVITAMSKNSDYELIWWRLKTNSETPNISMIAGREPDNWSPTGEPEQICSCVISGVDRNCQIILEQTDTSSTYDYTEITVEVLYSTVPQEE